MIGIFINLWNRLTGGGSAPAPALLDTYGGAAAAFSLRKLSSTYGGSAVRVRRSLDNTEQDIGFSGDNLDETALQAFVGYENAFTYSEQFENAIWTKTQSTVTPNAGADPLGGNNAERWLSNVGATGHNLNQTRSLTAGQSYTISFWVKSNTGVDQSFLMFACDSIASSNLIATSSWQRFTFTFVATTSTAHGLLRPSSLAAVDLLIFGAQINQGVTAQPYQQTTATANTANGFVTKWYTQDSNGENLFLQSQTFENTYWQKSDTSISANATTAPDGTLTAEKLTESAINSVHYIASPAGGMTTTQFYTISFYAKAAERNWIAVYLYDGTTSRSTYFNLSTGVIGTVPVGYNASIQNAGNGWYRCSVSATVVGSATTNGGVVLAIGDNQFSYLGVAGSGVFIWGAQLSQSSWLQGYQATTTTAVSRRDASQATAASQPRIVNAGVIERENGKSAIYFNGSTFLLPQNTVEIFNNVGYAQGYTVSNIAQSPIGGLIFSALTSGVTKFNISNFTTGFGVGGRRLVGDAFASAIIGYKPLRQFISSSQLNYQTSDAYQYINGMLLAQNTSFQTDGLTVGTSLNGIGAQSDGTNGMIGDIQELLLYNTNTTPNTLQISQNQNSYFNVFWQGTQQALLDQFGGSAAAFSLRNLSSSYRGPLVRVRRSSDNAETDIGGTFSGDLDVNSLLAFTGGQNLLPYSQDYTQVTWNKLGVVAVASATFAPDGTLTAQKINETAGGSFHILYTDITTSGAPMTYSFYAKAAERNTISVQCNNITTSSTVTVLVDLSTGLSSVITGVSGVYISHSVVNVGNGWWRIAVSGSTGSVSSHRYQTVFLNNGQTSYAGVAGSGVYVWGAQLTTGSVLQPYIPTTTAAINGANAFVTKWYDQSGIGDNTVLDSQEFNLWNAASISISTNSTTAPDGTLTADTITHTAASGEIFEYFSSPSNSIFTSSVYVKYINTQWIRFNVGFGNGAYAAVAWFDCLNGVVGSTQLVGSPAPSISNLAISNAGNGWWRISFSSVASTALVQNYIQLNSATADSSSTRVNGASYFVWGAQVSNGSELLRYQPTTTAIAPKRDAIQTTAASQPRIVNAGSVESENGKPSMFYDGSNDNLSFSGIDVGDISYSVFLKNTPIDTARGAFVGSGAGLGGGPYVGSGGGNTAYVQTVGSTDYYYEYLNHPSYIAQFLYSAFATQSSSDLYINGNLLPAPSRVSFTAPTHLLSNIGLHISFYGKFNTSEAIIYASNVMSNRSSIDSNINTYYQIYWQGNGTALLDSFSGASAAYSLRNLSSAYTGPLIRVRRSSDNAERDIYGTFRGDLDLAALTSFVGANSGFVTTWYDQSGTGRHATQATAASQPRIVNAGAVDTLGGKPSLIFDGTNDFMSFAELTAPQFTSFYPQKKDANADKSAFFSSTNTGKPYTPIIFGTGLYISNAAAAYVNTTYQNLNYILMSGYMNASNQGFVQVNGTNVTLITHSDSGSSIFNTMNARIGDFTYSKCSVPEMILYAFNNSANVSAINNSINNYYKIY